MAKTKEEFQAAVNDVRRVLEQHGVVLVAAMQLHKDPAIELLDAEELRADPSSCYTWFMDPPPHEGTEPKLLPFNKVEQEWVIPLLAGGRKAWTRIRAIGDVKGVIPTRITIHRYSTAISDVNVGKTVDVVSLDEVEHVDFVKEFRDARFKRFVIGLGDGPFGTLIAEYNDHVPTVVGFIEGPSPDELLKKWPLAQKGAHDGGV